MQGRAVSIYGNTNGKIRLVKVIDQCLNLLNPNRHQIIHISYKTHGHTLEVVDSSRYLGFTISDDLTLQKEITGKTD